jgi:hypothetical protein
MRTLFLYFHLLLFTNCSSQETKEAWLAKNYVKAIEHGDTNVNSSRVPIEGFQIRGDQVEILMYRAEVAVVKYQRIHRSGMNKLKLLNLEYYVNLKYSPRSWVDKFIRSEVFLIINSEELIVEIVDNKQTEKITFVNKINGRKFTRIIKAKEYAKTLKK